MLLFKKCFGDYGVGPGVSRAAFLTVSSLWSDIPLRPSCVMC